MSNQAILERAFIAAIENGYEQKPEEPNFYRWPEALIFNHDFAKALWGEDFIISHHANNLGQVGSWHQTAWRHHLQQMVIADDPIKYLGEHLDS